MICSHPPYHTCGDVHVGCAVPLWLRRRTPATCPSAYLSCVCSSTANGSSSLPSGTALNDMRHMILHLVRVAPHKHPVRSVTVHTPPVASCPRPNPASASPFPAYGTVRSYRGYGLSKGTPNEVGLKRDAEAGLRYVLSRQDLDTSRVVLFGRSLGGAVTIYLAATQGDKVGTGGLPS